MSGRPEILVIGSLNVDYVTYTARIPLPGETLTSTGFAVGCGGKGANQAVACAKLSRRPVQRAQDEPSIVVKMLGAVGDDHQGMMMKENLTSSGVDVSSLITTSEVGTGVAIIIVEESTGENRILISPNANAIMKPDLFRTLPSSPLPSLIIMQLEIPKETVIQILHVAGAEGAETSSPRPKIPVLLNPAPALPLPDSIYKHITHLILNETEAAILSEIRDCDPDTLDVSTLAQIAQKFLTLGTENVIITLGAKGVYYATNTKTAGSTASGLVPSHPTTVVDTTAAGDTFVGSYAVAILNGASVSDAVQTANRAASITVSRKGAMASIPWGDEIDS